MNTTKSNPRPNPKKNPSARRRRPMVPNRPGWYHPHMAYCQAAGKPFVRKPRRERFVSFVKEWNYLNPHLQMSESMPSRRARTLAGEYMRLDRLCGVAGDKSLKMPGRS